jgi:hypothetical protein
MERREFLMRFGATTAVVLYGISPLKALAGTTTLDLTGTASGFSLIGEQIYTTAGTYTWIAPSGLTNVHAVCIGAGGVGGSISAPYNGRGGGGGGLGWKNNISVSPGVSYTVVAGAAKYVRGFSVSGFITSSAAAAMPLIITSNATINSIKAYCKTTGSGVNIDILKNGTSIFTGGYTLNMASSSVVTATSSNYNSSLLTDDILELSVTMAEAGVSKDLVVSIELIS